MRIRAPTSWTTKVTEIEVELRLIFGHFSCPERDPLIGIRLADRPFDGQTRVYAVTCPLNVRVNIQI